MGKKPRVSVSLTKYTARQKYEKFNTSKLLFFTKQKSYNILLEIYLPRILLHIRHSKI